METLRGVAQKVRFSTVVSGGENHTSTSHLAVFEVNRTPVELSMPESIFLENGDEIFLAGKIKKGVFKAIAYKNLTNNVSGKGQVILPMLLGIIFTIVGLGTIPFGIGLIFAPVGIYSIRYSRQMSEAYRLVTSSS
ncbi:hypothetical protein CN03_12410 [Thalassolituus oleivorans]|uniref:hypothetical protein n=1 Tax=Thalassolituus oleivorans TaxID=187493 RepID=UPI00094941E4|nr:hypothetical protein [Thalassolituus oleivorans]APR67660.1 hypothetical protein CN03_12410 [Thalassolituus oleivorans]